MSLSPQEALIVLNLIPGLGSIRIQNLLEVFGSAELVLAAPAAMLERVPRIGPAMAAAIADWANCTNLDAELACAEQHGVRLVTFTDDDYPFALRRMSNPPIVLYARGAWQEADDVRGVAVIGTRLATPYGRVQARRFGRELADAGCTIISGLARGIDEEGHRGALDAGGRTIAVLGYGMGQIANGPLPELPDMICDGHGAVVSEFPMMMRASRTTFPQRNRIVAAWSRAAFVAEAPLRSGAIHTAGLAAEHGNTVFALPGDVSRDTSAGCHALIRDGATLCTCPQDILSDLGWDAPQQLDLFPTDLYAEEKGQLRPAASPAPAPAAPALPLPDANTLDFALLEAVAQGHDTIDALCAALGHPAHELTPLLMKLQYQHFLIPLAGGRYARPARQ